MIQRNIFIIFIFFFPFSQSFSQGWFTYSDQEWFFSVNFPHEPEIEEIIYPSEWGGFYPGRIYRADLNNQTLEQNILILDILFSIIGVLILNDYLFELVYMLVPHLFLLLRIEAVLGIFHLET